MGGVVGAGEKQLLKEFLLYLFSNVCRGSSLNVPRTFWIKVTFKVALMLLFSRAFVSKNYFTSSDPHHDMLGGGCQVRVVI